MVNPFKHISQIKLKQGLCSGRGPSLWLAVVTGSYGWSMKATGEHTTVSSCFLWTCVGKSLCQSHAHTWSLFYCCSFSVPISLLLAVVSLWFLCAQMCTAQQKPLSSLHSYTWTFMRRMQKIMALLVVPETNWTLWWQPAALNIYLWSTSTKH